MAVENQGSYGPHALTAAIVTTAGAVLSLPNPEGDDLIVTRMIVDVTTVATGAAALDAGIAADGKTSSDTIFDGLDVHSATGVFDNADATNRGTHGKASVKWPSDEYLTVTTSATLAGMVANVYIEFIHA